MLSSGLLFRMFFSSSVRIAFFYNIALCLLCQLFVNTTFIVEFIITFINYSSYSMNKLKMEDIRLIC